MEQFDRVKTALAAKSKVPGARAAARIALVIQHLWELADSISFDCIGQFHLLRDLGGEGLEIRIFCEEDHRQREGGPTEPISSLRSWLDHGTDAYVIYHYCDGWPEFDTAIAGLPAKVVVRWHNNTPPWFFARYSPISTMNTIRGLQNVMAIGAQSDATFWVNSTYSANQLRVLGVAPERLHVVYPVSSLLFEAPHNRDRGRSGDLDVIDILFVGRVVPHKGYLHLVMTAATLQARFGRRVRLTMVGRHDSSMAAYVQEIEALAEELEVHTDFPAEVSYSDLQDFYRRSDVFLCLSEHEGFGLPIFEAMRFGLPVVGLRSTAIGEFLAHHPLAIQSMDYQAAAENILAAIEPQLCRDIVQWQDENLVSYYSTGLVTEQLASGLQGRYSMPLPTVAADPAIMGAVERFREALTEAHSAPARLSVPKPPADSIDHYITRYDVEAFAALAVTASVVSRRKRGPIKRVMREAERFVKRTWLLVAAAGGAR